MQQSQAWPLQSAPHPALQLQPQPLSPPLNNSHFVNLTNGLEALPLLHRLGLPYSYCRICSTGALMRMRAAVGACQLQRCLAFLHSAQHNNAPTHTLRCTPNPQTPTDIEQQNFEAIITGLDANMLMALALGHRGGGGGGCGLWWMMNGWVYRTGTETHSRCTQRPHICTHATHRAAPLPRHHKPHQRLRVGPGVPQQEQGGAPRNLGRPRVCAVVPRIQVAACRMRTDTGCGRR